MELNKRNRPALFIINSIIIATGITLIGMVIRMYIRNNEILAHFDFSLLYAYYASFVIYWCLGVPYIIVAVLGYIGAGFRNRVLLIIYTIACVIAMLAEGVMFIFLMIGLLPVYTMDCGYDSTICYCRDGIRENYSLCVLGVDQIDMSKGLIAMVVLGGIMTLAGCGVTCVALCGGQQQGQSQSFQPPGTAVMPNYQYGGGIVYQAGPQTVQLAVEQAPLYQPQQIAYPAGTQDGDSANLAYQHDHKPQIKMTKN